jgi:hypothetical protein
MEGAERAAVPARPAGRGCFWRSRDSPGLSRIRPPDSHKVGEDILGAQAILRSRKGGSDVVVVATENTRHLSRICAQASCTAKDWRTIT